MTTNGRKRRASNSPTARARLRARNAEIARLWNEGELSYSKLAARFDLSVSGIAKIVRQHNEVSND